MTKMRELFRDGSHSAATSLSLAPKINVYLFEKLMSGIVMSRNVVQNIGI